MAMWSEAAHPRNAKGPGGGEFKSAKAGGTKAQTASSGTRTKSGGTLSYNGRTGTGYGSPHGDPRVKKLQTALNRLGIKDANGRPLKVDGKLGPLTTQAIKAWQRKNGMRPTGAITAADLKRLTARKTHSKAALTKKKALKAATPPRARQKATASRRTGGMSLDTQTAIRQSIARRQQS